MTIAPAQRITVGVLVLLLISSLSNLASGQTRQWGAVSNVVDGDVANHARDLGVSWLRVGNRTTCSWAQAQPLPDSEVNIKCAHYLIQNALDNGFNVYFTIEGTPWWAGIYTRDGTLEDGPDAESFGAYVRSLLYQLEHDTIDPDDPNHILPAITRMDRVVFGIWDEPDSWDFLHDYNGILYKMMVQEAATSRNQVDPNIVLAFPDVTSQGAISGYYANVMNAVSGYMAPQDIVTVHNYVDQPALDYVMQQIINSASGHQVWLTEFGAAKSDQSKQAAFYASVLFLYSSGTFPSWTNVFPFLLLPGRIIRG